MPSVVRWNSGELETNQLLIAFEVIYVHYLSPFFFFLVNAEKGKDKGPHPMMFRSIPGSVFRGQSQWCLGEAIYCGDMYACIYIYMYV